jgi:hypothetical protein
MNKQAFLEGYMSKEAAAGRLVRGLAGSTCRGLNSKAGLGMAAGAGALGLREGGKKLNSFIDDKAKKRVDKIESISEKVKPTKGAKDTPAVKENRKE